MLEHPIEVVHYVGVRDPHKVETRLPQPVRPALVINGLIGMGIAIDFDDQTRLGAEEIGDEWPKPDLAPKFVTMELASLERLPKHALGGSR
jgi:hypothetical protein